MAINQVEMIEEGVMNIANDMPVDNNLLVSLPAEQPASYEYLNDVRTTYSSIPTTLDTPTATGMRFKRHNCATWEYPMIEKKVVKIRVALQEGVLFLDLEDILEGVCGIDVTPSKIANITKGLVPVG